MSKIEKIYISMLIYALKLAPSIFEVEIILKADHDAMEKEFESRFLTPGGAKCLKQ